MNAGLPDFLLYLLFLAVQDLCCCVWAFSSRSKWKRSFFTAVHGLLNAMASLVMAHRLYSAGSVVVAHRLSCPKACGSFWNQG